MVQTDGVERNLGYVIEEEERNPIVDLLLEIKGLLTEIKEELYATNDSLDTIKRNNL